MYVVGKTGTGKSSLLVSMARQDLEAGNGFCFIDPHGDAVSLLAASSRRNVIYWDVADPHSPYGYNPLRSIRADRIPLAVSGVLEAMKKLWKDAWGVRMEHILRNALYALFEIPESTLEDILQLLSDDSYRHTVCGRVTNEPVRRFWRDEFPKYSKSYRSDGAAPIQNKVGAFLADPIVRQILTNPKTDLHLRRIMDDRGVLLVNMGKGRLGEDSANLLGSFLVSTLALAGISRADQPFNHRSPFYVYLDEFHSFTTISVASMVAELRKYGVGLILAHQHLAQLEPEVRSAVLGNSGSTIIFRLGAEDARYFAHEFSPAVASEDFLSLPNFEIYARIMVDGVPTPPFSATTEEVQLQAHH